MFNPPPRLNGHTFRNQKKENKKFAMSSSAFEDGGNIPVRFCKEEVEGGENISLPVSWSNIPEETQSLFLVLFDPHPVAQDFIHWVVADIPTSISGLQEGASGENMPASGKELINGYGDIGYGGPQPPAGTGPHPYTLILFALNSQELDLPNQPSWAGINLKLAPIIITSVKMVGYYGR